MKVFACLCLIAIVSVLSACATTPAAPATEPGGVVRWSLEGISDVTSLDPARSVDYQSTIVRGLIFAGLVRLDAELNVVPDGAASWTVSADGTRYTFTLRENLRFGDGTPVMVEIVFLQRNAISEHVQVNLALRHTRSRGNIPLTPVTFIQRR
jgi:ABC-type transport system substrate-binding protein